jgi:hypothetical protein
MDPLSVARWTVLETDLRCPITQEVLVDPVVCADGHTYERAAIAEWFATGKLSSPTTNELLASQLMLPNHAVRRLALSLRREQGQRVLGWCECAPITGGAEELLAMVEGGAADLDVRDGKGRTPLLLLLQRGRDDLASLLLDRGALASATDEEGHTAADLAVCSPLAARLRAAATLEGRQRMARAQVQMQAQAQAQARAHARAHAQAHAQAHTLAQEEAHEHAHEQAQAQTYAPAQVVLPAPAPALAQVPVQQTSPQTQGEATTAQARASLHHEWATSAPSRHPIIGSPAVDADGAPRAGAATFFPSLFALQFVTLQQPLSSTSALVASSWLSDSAEEDSPIYRLVNSLGLAIGGSLFLGVCFFT